MSLPRWLAAAGGVILFVASVGLALAGVPHAISGPGDLFSNLGRNLITALAVALLAYVWFSFGTSYYATHRLRDEARHRPERLFEVPPGVGKWRNVFGRDRLVDQLATNLKDEFRTGPQVLIGESGSGKTSLLLALAAHFARQDVYPIILSLRDVDNIDFTAMAESRFKEYVDPHVRAAEDADKLWRWVCRRGQIVVLADDLDRAKVPGMAADPYKTAVRVALEAADRRRLPLVVASRPEALPPDLNVVPVPIGQLELDHEEATTEVLSQAGRREDDPEREKVREYIERGNLTANPFYLGLLVDMLRLPSAPKPPPSEGEGEYAVRVALLETWRAGLLDEELILEDERRRRKRILDRMAEFGASRLTPRLDARTDDPATSEHEWLSDLHEAERLDVVEMDDDGRHRFKHDVLHAFFASNKRDKLLDALKGAPDAPRVQLAVVFAAAASRRQATRRGRRFCRKACQRLTETHGEADERRLLRAAAAAEVANAGGFHALDERIAATCREARRPASPVIRRAALEQLAQLRGEGVIEALWDFAGDDDYDVRWAAAQKLIERCSGPASSRHDHGGVWPAGLDAYKVLVRRFEESLSSARPLRNAHDRHPDILALKHMAWILPALRSPAKGWLDRELRKERRPDALLDQLIWLAQQGVSSELGLEASIAQGFKVDALRLITASDGDVATASVSEETVSIEKERDQLSRAKFWYSQLNLLHAITVRVAYGVAQGYGIPNDGKRHLTILRRSKYVRELVEKDVRPHPYVRAAAELCDRAIDLVRRDFKHSRGKDRKEAARQALGRYIWGDEGVLVSQQPAELDKGEVAQSVQARTDGGADTDRSSGLAGAAIQLVADIAILLNMNETGNEQQRRSFATKSALPYCMQQSRDRNELFDKCRGSEECDFGLCPYEPAINRPSAHREISRGFCRHQQHQATHHAARRWGSKVRTRELRELWEELETMAEM